MKEAISKYILKAGFSTIFIPIYAFLAIITTFWLNNYSYELADFNNRSIGISTLEMVDVAKRIKIFYRIFFIGAFVFVSVNTVVNILQIKLQHGKEELSYINYSCLTGGILLLFHVLFQKVLFSIQLINVLLVIFTLILIFRQLVKKSSGFSQLHLYGYLFILLQSFSLALCITLLSKPLRGDFLIIFAIVAICLLVFFSFGFVSGYRKKIIVLSWPVVVAPFLLILSQEFCLIMNQRNIFVKFPTVIFIVFLLFAFSISCRLWLKNRKRIAFTNYKNTVCKYYFPLFLLSLSMVAFYTPFAPATAEMFELANPAISVMNFFKFGEIPVLDFLCTHLVSDFLLGFIYTFFNGYEPTTAFLAYEFILQVIAMLVFYFFMKNITQNSFIAFIIILFFPFLIKVFWGFKGMMLLLVPLITYRLYKKNNFGSYILFFLVLLIQMSWRPDTGFMALVTMFFGFVFVISQNRHNIPYKKMVFSFFLVFVPLIIGVFIIGEINDIPVISSIKQTLGFYSSSPQARGLPVLTYNDNDSFRVQYIVFPCLVFFLFVYNLFNYKRLLKEQEFLFIAVFLLSIMYFSNIQRGLSRHSFCETDSFIASFSFLIIGLSMYFISFKNRVLNHLLFIGIISFLVIAFSKNQVRSSQNIFASLKDNIQTHHFFIKSGTKIDRSSINGTKHEPGITELLEFLQANLDDDATFFDFSNTPMLYFHSQKKLPVYFIHFLAITTESLLLKNLEYLKKHKVPLIVFSHHPTTWYDNTDGISNRLRYFQLAEYIYANYQPSNIAGGFFIWRRNDYALPHANDSINNKQYSFQEDQLKKLPYLWANYDNKESRFKKIIDLDISGDSTNLKNVSALLPEYSDYGNCYMDVEVMNKQMQSNEFEVKYYINDTCQGRYFFDVLARDSLEKYRIRMSIQYHWSNFQPDSLVVSAKREVDTRIKSLQLLTGDN